MPLNTRSLFSRDRAPRFAALALSLALVSVPALHAQAPSQPAPPADGTPLSQAPTTVPGAADTTLTNTPQKKGKVAKSDRVQQTKDTKAANKKEKKLDPLVGKDAQLPDKQLYDKALAQQKSGHYDIARLDLQTLLNTYPDSQYQMRAKLAVADSWYKEGGSAALTQAEQEYKDFITFFPNVPEAAEAQLRVGDIYFKQMDVPDRDYSKGVHAQEEYRTMLKQYPDAPKQLTDDARQKLREVQEVMATREAELGAFYSTHANWPAAIARYQTVIDTYPLYSHMDDTLIGIGDAYAAEAAAVRAQKLPEGPRAALLAEYDGKAAAAYRNVVLNHAAAPHVEDAKERLAGMNLPIPTASPEQVAASEALEGSRAQYNLQKRLALFFLHKPDTVTAAGTGEPSLEDPPPTTAPTIVRGLMADYRAAFNPASADHTAVASPAADAPADPNAPAAPAAPVQAAPLALSDVPAAGQGSADTTTTTPQAAPASSGTTGSGIGVEVLSPGVRTTPVSNLPAATGAQDPNYGLHTAAPTNTTALPPVEAPAEAPDQVNDIAGKPQPPIPATDPNAKKTKAPAVDKTDESSSKKHPKKGLDKLNPF